MHIAIGSIIKTVLFFFILLIIGPIALVVYILGRATRIFGDNNSFGNVLTKLYGWPTTEAAPKTHSETDWLNGLRGFAATMVMFHHLNSDLLGMQTAAAPFGATLQRDYHWGGYINYQAGHRLWEPWRLPILRLFVISGNAQVAIFFVLSGFVLSWSPLRMVHSGKQEQFCNYLGSLMFRRWFRLYLPCFFVASIYTAASLIRRKHMRSSIGQFFWEIWNFLGNTELWQRPFYADMWKAVQGANTAMWTIPWEYAGSIYLVVVLLCAGRFHDPIIRIYSVTALSVYAACIALWVYALFGFGIALCDYVLYHGGFEALSNNISARSRSIWAVVAFIGLYFLGFAPPRGDGAWDIPGYQWMCLGSTSENLIRYWAGIGALLFVTSACHLTSIRYLFDASLFQYLGRISFMLYLIHNFVIEHVTLILRDTLLVLLIPWQFDEVFKQHIYKTSSLSLIFIWATCTLYTVALTFVTANWLEIFIDQPCTRLSRMIDKTLTSGTFLKENRTWLFSSTHPRHLDSGTRNDEESLPLHSTANGHDTAESNSVSKDSS